MKLMSLKNSDGLSSLKNQSNQFPLESKIVSFGQFCLKAAATIQIMKPMLMIAMMIGFTGLAFVSPALAQTGGASLGGNSSNPINAFKSALNIGVWVLLGLGIGGIGWGIYNVMFGNGFARQFIGGGCALGFAGIVALINDVSNDAAPTTPTW